MSKEWFKLTKLSRDDVEAGGFDQTKLSDHDMERLADFMVNTWIESGYYWEAIDEFCQSRGLQKKQE